MTAAATSGRALRAALLLLAAGAAAVSCGKKGPTQPPLAVRPAAPKALQAGQRGGTVWISIREPEGRTDGSDFLEPVLLRLYLLPGTWGEGASERPGARPLPPSRAGGPTWVVPREEWERYRVGDRLEIPLSLGSLRLTPEEAGAAPAGRKIAFAAEIQEGKRKRSEAAGPVRLTLCTAPAPPAALYAEATEPGIRLAWEPPAAGIEARIYRGVGGAPPGDKPHATVSGGGGSFLDRAVAVGSDYAYELRFASGDAQATCESNPVRASARAVDTFPPAPPSGLAAAAEPELIRLFWTPGAEPDIAGYIVYRKRGDGEAFEPITPGPITETTYADSDVKAGVRYTYAVTAVDGAMPPNESALSHTVTEALP